MKTYKQILEDAGFTPLWFKTVCPYEYKTVKMAMKMYADQKVKKIMKQKIKAPRTNSGL